MRIVSPFRPFVPESVEHMNLGPFDWHSALEMSRESVTRLGGEWFALTDVDTTLHVPALKYQTVSRRLMVWIVEIALRYLESAEFDCDTVMMSPDMLLYGRLEPFVQGDLGVVVRTGAKYRESGRTVLNACQVWRHAAQARLVAFYRQAVAIAQRLPEERLRWGGDTDPLIQLLAPIGEAGLMDRGGLQVFFIDEAIIMDSVTEEEIGLLRDGRFKRHASAPMTDFKYKKKLAMAAYFDATIGRAA